MANINRPPGSEKQNFKQIESDNWSGLYLPAICAGVVMTVVLFMAVSCSKKSDNSSGKISAPTAPAVTSPAPVATTASIPQAPKKAIRKHRPANATYVNSTYGIAISYPRKYSLQSADKQKEMPVETGFSTPGAVEIASVDMPDSGYPDTDFSSALLNVSIKPGMTAEECSTFADPASQSNVATTASSDSAKSTDAPKPTTIKLGANEYSEIEQMKGTSEHQSDLKYFHLFKNGGCYEFALDVETSRKADEELAQVDRGQVFRQLEKVLATAKIKEVELPGIENAEKAAPVTTDLKTEVTEKAQVLTPVETPVEQK